MTHPADSGGCFFYRIRVPSAMLAHAKVVDRVVEAPFYLPSQDFKTDQGQIYQGLDSLRPEMIIVQRQTEPDQAKGVLRYKELGQTVVHELDDLLWNVPASNPFINFWKPRNYKALKTVLEAVDHRCVSTEPLAVELEKQFGVTARVSPNLVSGQFFSPPRRREGRRLRVGWAGSSTHEADLAPLFSVIRQTSKIIDWRFLGWMPKSVTDMVGEGHVTFHPPVEVSKYMGALRDMDVDVAIAPLHMHIFNECKSHLKLLEFSALGMPVVCTDIYPYRESPTPLIKNRNSEWKEWTDRLLGYAHDEDLRMEDAQKHYEWAFKYMLENPANLTIMKEAWGL